MSDLATIIDGHLAAYCEPDAGRRAELFDQAWAPDGSLIDPPMDAVGTSAIAALTDTVLTHYPEHRFERTTEIDTHHRYARYGWALVAPDGTCPVTGTDVVDLDDDGRIARIVGFFGDLEPAGSDASGGSDVADQPARSSS